MNRPCCFLDSGWLHNPWNTASPHYPARFPHLTLMVPSVCTNLWVAWWNWILSMKEQRVGNSLVSWKLSIAWTILLMVLIQFSSVQSLSHVRLFATPWTAARPPCPSPTPRIHPNSCPLSQWCHPTVSSSLVPFPSCPQSFPASGSFQMSELFASGGQSIGVSASTSILPVMVLIVLIFRYGGNYMKTMFKMMLYILRLNCIATINFNFIFSLVFSLPFFFK